MPRGQHEAADALGLSYWKKNGLIILPQAMRHVIPPLVNTFIGFFKDTSLVLIIGFFDLLTTAKTAIIDPAWQFSASRSTFRGADLFRVLLCDVELQPQPRGAGQPQGANFFFFFFFLTPSDKSDARPHGCHSPRPACARLR